MHRIAQYSLKLVREASFPYMDDTISSPEDAAKIMYQHYDGSDREIFSIIALNIKNKVIGIHDVSVGSLTASVVHPREVFKALIMLNAAGTILCHCHPSLDTTPSREDINVTRQLVDAGKLLDIPVLDHVITGTDAEFSSTYTSLKEEGLL